MSLLERQMVAAPDISSMFGNERWFNRLGRQLGHFGPTGTCGGPTISRDGKKVAFDFADGSNRDVWIADITSGETQRLTYDPEVDHSPVWSADDTRLVFDSHRGGLGDPFVKATNGASSEIRLLPWRATLGAEDWSGDGKMISFISWSGEAQTDIWMLPLEKGSNPVPYLQTKANERHAKFSPNNRWVAYTSDESGKNEVYVQADIFMSHEHHGKELATIPGELIERKIYQVISCSS
jgi:Tol biopolymer transport system component